MGENVVYGPVASWSWVYCILHSSGVGDTSVRFVIKILDSQYWMIGFDSEIESKTLLLKTPLT